MTSLGSMGLVYEARAQEEQLTIAGRSGNAIIIREHAGWNRRCEAIAHPALYLAEPPSHGNVCARIENIKISSMYVGTESQCVGHLVLGVRLVYRPDVAYAGGDSLRYAAQYPGALRTVQVQIDVTPHAAGAVPPSIVAPVSQARQAPGTVPACAEPIF
ncbi:MAG: hypothetical protein Q7V40_02070 [Pseudolabrys sp.]|nr:hypothetical protein [Pseudolabrys sp.]